jgi:pantoate ligase/cytidylate kinase
MTELVNAISRIRQRLSTREPATRLGLVPTMGALHAGHASLINRARQECGIVVVSIFVNPLQFDSRADLEGYPHDLEVDLQFCSRMGADIVFAPTAEDMYPEPPACTVDVGRLGEGLCGRFRPGHFQGVATVVMKLLQIVQPGLAYFGEKDAQQLAIIRRLVADFNVPVGIVGVPTIRDGDGLALSSRNRRLSEGDRVLAPALYQALDTVRRDVAAGATDPAAIRARALEEVPQDASVKIEYLELVNPSDLRPVERVAGPVLAAGALWVGGVRLIDNVYCEQERT